MNEDEAHAVFAEAMAASGFTVDSSPQPQGKQRNRNSPSTPRRRWANAEEEWQRAAQNKNDDDDDDDDDTYEDDDDDDSLFDDLKSVDSKRTTGSRSRAFLVDKEDGEDSSDDEDQVSALTIKLGKGKKSPNLGSVRRYTPSASRHSDSESTVATSNTRQSSVRTERAVVLSSVDHASMKGRNVRMLSKANTSASYESEDDDDEEDDDEKEELIVVTEFSQQQQQQQYMQNDSGTGIRTPVSHSRGLSKTPSPSNFITPQGQLKQTNSVSSTSKVKKVILPTTQSNRSNAVDTNSLSISDDNWANFDEGFFDPNTDQILKTPSPQPKNIQTNLHDSQKSNGNSKTSIEEQDNSKANEIKVEVEISEKVSRNIGRSQRGGGKVASGSTYDSDYSDDVSASSMGSEKTVPDHAKEAGCQLTGVPEHSDIQCNTDANAVGWMLSAMGLGDNSTSNNTVSDEIKVVQEYDSKGAVVHQLSSLTAETEDSLQAWLGYATDLLFPPLGQCGGVQNASGQTEVNI